MHTLGGITYALHVMVSHMTNRLVIIDLLGLDLFTFTNYVTTAIHV